jgi:hypothetical protein
MHVHVHVNEELSSVSIKLKVQRTFNIQAIQASILPNVLPVPSGCVMTCHILDNTRKLNRRVWLLSDEDFTVFYSFNYSGGYRGSS